MLKAVIFDLGNTLIHQQIDNDTTLDNLQLELYPNAKETLKAIWPEYRLGLLTNTETSTARNVTKALEKLGIGKYFSCVVTSVDVSLRKPDPRIFVYVMNELGVDPSEAIMVGNDMDADITGANAVGMRTVFFSLQDDDWRRRRHSDILPDYSVKDLSELPAILAGIDN